MAGRPAPGAPASGRSARSSTSRTTSTSSSASRCTPSISRGWPVPEIRVRRAKPGETDHHARRRRAQARARHAGHRRPRPRAGRSPASWAAPPPRSPPRRRRWRSRARTSSRHRCGATSKRLGLKTEASSRFERGADINAPVVAHAARDRADGADRRRRSPVDAIVDCYPQPRAPKTAPPAPRAAARSCSASPCPTPTSSGSCAGSGSSVTPAGDGWDAVAPTFRVDLLREADLIEEVGAALRLRQARSRPSR